jgi:selenocysteine lyase/cysteine desulfurase
MDNDAKQIIMTFLTIAIILIVGAAVLWIGFAELNLWSSSLSGQAELRQADWNRQIAVREAQAKKDSATLLAEAEIERAKGVAQANKIIGESLHNNENYLRYLWIDSLQQTKNQIVYVPTEAGLPILEAGKRQ